MGRHPYGRRESYMTRKYSSSSASLTPAAVTKYAILWDEIYAMKLKFRKFKSPPLPTEHKSRLTHARIKTLVAVDKKGEIVGKPYSSPITNPKYDAMFLIYIEVAGYTGRGLDIITDGIKYRYNFHTAKSHVFMPNPRLANVKLTTADKHKLDEAISLWETEGDWVQPNSSWSSCASISHSTTSATHSKNPKRNGHHLTQRFSTINRKLHGANHKIGP